MTTSKFLCVALLSATAMVGCGKDTPKAEPAKPAAVVSAATPSAAPVAAAAKPAKATAAAPKKLDADKKHAVPADWERMVNTAKGFAFSVPKGTKSHQETKDGLDLYLAEVPAPHAIQIIVVAFKDASKSKADLQNDAVHMLTALGEHDVKAEPATTLTPDYDLFTIKSVDSKKIVTHAKGIVGTDVTDNYVMLVGSPEKEFKANEETMDEIWGSFEMFSAGASGSN